MDKNDKELTLQQRNLKKYALATIALWSLVISLSLYVTYQSNAKHLMDLGRIIARSSLEKDILYRRWNAAQGGVYAKPSKLTTPNPYLHIAERDIITSRGKRLTMINPAYMTRQVHEIGRRTNGIQGHITSLNPIREANKPDSWERLALEKFEQGANEVSSIEIINEKQYLRLMQPLTTEKSCLKCHQQQGYVQGQIRGGISQSVPMALLTKMMKKNLSELWIKHLMLWLAGTIFIYFTYRALAQKTLKLGKANKKLGELALTDVLTGLFNRRYARQQLKKLWKESIEHGTPLACMLIDADNFKEVNDNYGHEAGDVVLREIAKELQNAVRTDDIVCRLGGDEFFIICPNTDEAGCMHIANITLAKVLALSVDVGAGTWQGSISIGVAVKKDSMENIGQLIKAADQGVYAAKDAGRGCIRLAKE